MTEAEFAGLVSHYGLWVVTPVALVEGPVIAIVSGYLASLGLISLPWVYACLVLADLTGDLGVYAFARGMRRKTWPEWVKRIGPSRRRVALVLWRFRKQGTSYLVLAKLTHAAGAAALFAAGLARMPLRPFLLANTLATLPKVAAFLGLGWGFGNLLTASQAGHWGVWAAAIGLFLAIGLIAMMERKGRKR